MPTETMSTPMPATRPLMRRRWIAPDLSVCHAPHAMNCQCRWHALIFAFAHLNTQATYARARGETSAARRLARAARDLRMAFTVVAS